MSETQQSGHIQLPEATGADSGSMRQILAQNLGREVVAEFLIGTDEIVRKSGTLYAAEEEYIVLADDMNLTEIVCSMPSLRFVTFYLPGARPDANGSAVGDRRDGQARGSAQPAPSAAGTARAQTQAAFNYARRKTRKLE